MDDGFFETSAGEDPAEAEPDAVALCEVAEASLPADEVDDAADELDDPAELDAEPSSAWATPDPPARAAPTPSVMAPAPSQAYASVWRWLLRCRPLRGRDFIPALPRVATQLPSLTIIRSRSEQPDPLVQCHS